MGPEKPRGSGVWGGILTTEASTAPASKRIHGLDALRGVLMMLGVVLHTALSYLPDSEWPFLDWAASSKDLGILTDGIHMFRMPAFFFLSGFFGALLWQRRGAKAMVKNRIQRILWPLLMFVVVLHVLVQFSFGFAGGVADHLAVPLDKAWADMVGNPFPFTETMHLWFLNYLVWVTAFTVMLASTFDRLEWRWVWFMRITHRVMESPWLFVLVLGGLNTLWVCIHGWTYLPTAAQWEPEDTISSYYFLWYGLGWLLFTSGASMARFQEQAWVMVGLGVTATVLRHVLGEYYGEDEELTWTRSLFGDVLDGIGEPLAQVDEMGALFWVTSSLVLVAFTRGLMGLFLRYCGSGAPIWRYLSDSSYWVYLIHLPLTALIPSLLLGWDAHVFVKYGVSVSLVLMISWASYDSLIRPTVVGKFLNGRRYPALNQRWSGLGTLLAVVWLTMGMVKYPVIKERPPPWRKGVSPVELLPEASVIYPVQIKGSLPKNVTLDWCVGVNQYIFCVDKLKPEDMAHACSALGSSVALLKTREEQTKVNQIASKLTQSPFWLGISDAQYEGFWRWPDGSLLTARDAIWHENEPNNVDNEDCAAMNWHGSVGWIDIGCEHRMGFVCR